MIPINDVSPRLSKTIVIYTPKRLGATATVWLHEIARKLEEYNWPVDCWQIGKDSAGNEIKVDRLGRFLFGVPGYDGHIRVAANGSEITIYYPSEPAEAEALFNKLKSEIERKKAQDER